MRLVPVAAALAALCSAPVLALAAPQSASLPMDGIVIDGPPPPEPPAMISRDAAGQATVRSIKLTAPLRVDGRLDEGGVQRVPALRRLPAGRADTWRPSTEKTEVWVMFDADHIYVAAAAGTRRRRSSGSPTSCAATPTSCARTITSA